MIEKQHDAHVVQARTLRTLFYCEMSLGKGVSLHASWMVPFDKIAWAMLRSAEAMRMEKDGSWRDDLARLEQERRNRQ